VIISGCISKNFSDEFISFDCPDGWTIQNVKNNDHNTINGKEEYIGLDKNNIKVLSIRSYEDSADNLLSYEKQLSEKFGTTIQFEKTIEINGKKAFYIKESFNKSIYMPPQTKMFSNYKGPDSTGTFNNTNGESVKIIIPNVGKTYYITFVSNNIENLQEAIDKFTISFKFK